MSMCQLLHATMALHRPAAGRHALFSHPTVQEHQQEGRPNACMSVRQGLTTPKEYTSALGVQGRPSNTSGADQLKVPMSLVAM